jgi:hypothetical protein
MRELTVMRRYQENFQNLQGGGSDPLHVQQVSLAPEPPVAPLPHVVALAEDTYRGATDKRSLIDDIFDDALEVCKLSFGAGPRFC